MFSDIILLFKSKFQFWETENALITFKNCPLAVTLFAMK